MNEVVPIRKESVDQRADLYRRRQGEIATRGTKDKGILSARKITHTFDMADEAVVRLSKLDARVDQLAGDNDALRFALQRIEVTAALSAERIIEKFANDE